MKDLFAGNVFLDGHTHFFRKQMREIGKKFIDTSLETMQPSKQAAFKETITKVSQVVEDAAGLIVL